jgi:CBS domain-containing protein
MAATFGASTRATFTAIVFVFELTRDYEVIVPLMLATVIADLVFSALSEHSIMTEKLSHRGLRIGRHYGVDPFTTATVAQLMTTPVATLPLTVTLAAARATFVEGGHGAYPLVDDEGRAVAILTRGDVLAAGADPDADGTTAALGYASLDVVGVAPDDTAMVALHVMIDERVEHVPVFEHGHLVGICTRTDLLKVRAEQRQEERRQPGLAMVASRGRALRAERHPPPAA